MAIRNKTKRTAHRYLLGLIMGSLAAVSLLWLMQFLIASGEAALVEDRSVDFLEFVRLAPEEKDPPEKKKPEAPPEPEEPPVFPQPDPTDLPEGEGIPLLPPKPGPIQQEGPGARGLDIEEGEFLPLFKVQPIYPRGALSRGLEGHCDLEFAITHTGATADARVIECTNSIFERASIQALLKFKYKPRVVDGTPIAVTGLHHRITFRIAD